jgi:hypothetical protein
MDYGMRSSEVGKIEEWSGTGGNRFVLVLCWSLLVSAGLAVLCWLRSGLCWSRPVSLFVLVLCWSLLVSAGLATMRHNSERDIRCVPGPQREEELAPDMTMQIICDDRLATEITIALQNVSF